MDCAVRALLAGVAYSLIVATTSARAASDPNPFAAPGKERPNFLMLFADDMTFRALSAVGQLEVKTPNLDRLAARGVMFRRAFIQGGTSGAVCVASRAMLMTGRYLWTSGNRDGNCARSDSTLYPLWGQVLADAGYQTYAVGKWHNGPATLEKGFQTTSPTFLGGMLESTVDKGAAYFRPAPGNPWTPDDPKWKGHWMMVDGKVVHSSEYWADAAIRDLEEASRTDRPFFIYVAFNAPHDPRQAPRRFLDLYPHESLRVPWNTIGRHPFDLREFDGRDEILAPYPRTREIVQVHLQEYYAIISHLDAQVGRILDALDRSSRGNNTTVIFSADNGLAVGQHGLLGKQSLYEHSIRIPLLIAGPGIPQGKKIDALVYMQGLFATTCEMARVRVPETVQFPSLVPLITGKATKLFDDLYGAYVDRQRMVRTDRWKLILTPDAEMVQLFDVENDPWETTNLAFHPAHAHRIAELYDRLKAWMKRVDDPMPAAKLDATLEAFRNQQ